jgi:hypothetical protein
MNRYKESEIQVSEDFKVIGIIVKNKDGEHIFLPSVPLPKGLNREQFAKMVEFLDELNENNEVIQFDLGTNKVYFKTFGYGSDNFFKREFLGDMIWVKDKYLFNGAKNLTIQELVALGEKLKNGYDPIPF